MYVYKKKEKRTVYIVCIKSDDGLQLVKDLHELSGQYAFLPSLLT